MSTALLVGGAVTAFLLLDVTLLSAFDGWLVSWWTITIAASTALIPTGFALGWRSESDAHGFSAHGERAAISMSLIALLAGFLVIPSAQAVDRGPESTIPSETLRLAAAFEAGAVMPAPVRAASAQASSARQRAAKAQAALDHVDADGQALQDTIERRERQLQRFQRSVQRSRKAIAKAQKDYDEYARLDERATPDPMPDVDIPDYELPDIDPPAYDPSPPTTEDFGNGEGSVGLCNDGTLSDSVGRPGACSHHGGVQ